MGKTTKPLKVLEVKSKSKEGKFIQRSIYKLLISKALRYGLRVTRGSHSFTCHPHTNRTSLYTQTQGITALWLVLIAPTHEGMARLS